MADPTKGKVVNVHEAKTQLSKLLERAHAGEEIVLAKAGKPYARLMPLAQPEKPEPVLGRLAGSLPPIDDEAFFAALAEEELKAWEDDLPE